MPKKEKNKKTKKTIKKSFEQEDACIICLDNTDDVCILSQSLTVHTDDNHYWKQQCKCNILIHKSCMEKWMVYKNACPICLITMKKSPSIFLYLNRLRGFAYYIIFMYIIYTFFERLQNITFSKMDCLSI